MKNITKKIVSIILITAMVLSITPAIKTQAAVAYNTITVFVGDSWSVTMKKSGNYIGTVNGNKKGNEYVKDYATATISGTTLKIKGTKAGANTFYIYDKDGDLCRQVAVTVKTKPTITSISNKYQNSGSIKSTNIYLYVGQSSTATLNTSGSIGSYAWSTNNTLAITLSNTTSGTVTLKAVKTGTYTITGRVSTGSNGTLGTVSASKTITVYVYAAPTIDVVADGTSVSAISITKSTSKLLSYRTTNVGTSVKCDVDFKVASNSSSYISIKSNKLSALEGFPNGTTAYFTVTLTINSGDNVSNNNGKQTFTRTIPVTLSNTSSSSTNSYITLKNNEVLEDTINIYNYPFYIFFDAYDSSGSATFTFDVEDPSVATVTNSPVGQTSYKYQLVKKGTGTTKVTVTAKTSSTVHTKVYTVNTYDGITSLKVDNVSVLKGSSTPINFKGVKIQDYLNRKYSDVSLYKANLTYASSDESVAYIDNNGNIIANKSGTAVISVKYTHSINTYVQNEDGKLENIKVTNPSAKFTVIVNELTTDMYFTNESIDLTMGSSKTILPQCYPLDANTSKVWTWTTSNPAVASVSTTGKVTTYKPGRAKITAKTTDGSKIKATYTLNVLAKQPSYTVKSVSKGIKISWSSVPYAKKYYIYRSTTANGEYSKEGSSEGLNYVDEDVDPGKTYYYKVTAVPDAGSNYESAMGSAYKKVKYTLKSPSVKSVKKSNGGYRIKIKGTKYDGFAIYVGKKKKTKKLAAVITGKSSTVFISKKGTYYVRVRAYKEVGNKKVYSKYSKAKRFKVK